MEHALMCPQCNAPLAPSRFARSIVCAYCGTTVQLDEAAVPAALFQQAFRAWNSPETYAIPVWVSFGERHWALGDCLAHGHHADVHSGRLARWPTELVILKILRDNREAGILEHEWETLQALQNSAAPGADLFSTLLPQPVLHGEIIGGVHAGQRASIFRREAGFRYTFEDVLRNYPQGIPPQASIWVWRRILEVLSFLHASGFAHGALIPAHLLIQQNEHGLRLVGFGAAGRFGEARQTLPHGDEAFQPGSDSAWRTLSKQVDLVMSARLMAVLLGGNPVSAALPAAVPARLAEVVRRVALSNPLVAAREDAWALREELGQVATQVFGPPHFMPIVMPE
jgi:hypothetical protein